MSDNTALETLSKCGFSLDDIFAVTLPYKINAQNIDEKGQTERAQNMFETEYRLMLAASKLNHGKSMLLLGELFQGKKVQAARECTDPVSEAVKWWEKAFEHGEPRGYTNIGLMHLHEDIPGGGSDHGGIPYDPSKAFRYLKTAFENGDSKAGRHVGRCYLNGWGVDKNERKGYEYLKAAMDRHDSTATLLCADCLLTGLGVEKDTAKAIELYERLARGAHDMAAAAYKLAELYMAGTVVEKDEALAKRYYQITVDFATVHTEDIRTAALKALEGL